MRRFILIGIAMLLFALFATILVWYVLQDTIPLEVDEIAPVEEVRPNAPGGTGSTEIDEQQNAKN